MRSWKTPALLATIGLSGWGSLFAQVPALPPVTEPTPAASSVQVPVPPAPAPNDTEIVAPAAVSEPVEQSVPVPVHESAPIVTEVPVSNGTLEIHPAPSTQVVAPPVESVVLPSPAPASAEFPQPACNCQGNGASYGAPAYAGSPGYGPVPPPAAGPIYTYGSGSGVAAGVLTPNSNSGGLHTRYPYYSYRAPWYYQGPPSLNVTIIW